MNIRKRVAFLAGLSALLGQPRPAEAATKPALASIVLTAKENGLEPQKEFSCHGKIHGYIRLAKRESGTHVLASRWLSPGGKVAGESQASVDFRPARSTAYVWFAFPESTGILGRVDPELDQTQLSYNGPWMLEVKWDNQPIIHADFNVRCP